MARLSLLVAGDIADIVNADGGKWWRRDESWWAKHLDEQSRGDRSVVVAREPSGVVGYANLIWRSGYHHFRDSRIPEISDLRVAERKRRAGIATAMVAYCEGLAADSGCAAIGLGVGLYADYGPAQRLYVKLGFIPDGFGITYGSAAVAAGTNARLDDDLLLWLVKDLSGVERTESSGA